MEKYKKKVLNFGGNSTKTLLTVSCASRFSIASKTIWAWAYSTVITSVTFCISSTSSWGTYSYTFIPTASVIIWTFSIAVKKKLCIRLIGNYYSSALKIQAQKFWVSFLNNNVLNSNSKFVTHLTHWNLQPLIVLPSGT